MTPTRRSPRTRRLYGAKSLWHTTSAGWCVAARHSPPSSSSASLASCMRRSRRPLCSRIVADQWISAGASSNTVPERYVRTSRPESSRPKGRGTSTSPRSARVSSNACTAAVHGPAIRRTVLPILMTGSILPPVSTSSSISPSFQRTHACTRARKDATSRRP